MAGRMILIVTFLFFGLLIIGLSIPLILEKIPPNEWYGFRTGKTLSSEQVWYKANKYAAKDLLIAGIIISIGSLALWPLVRSMSITAIGGIGTALMFIPLIIALIRAFIYIGKL